MSEAFKDKTTCRDTEYGIFFETKMPNCTYGQAFSKKDIEETSIQQLKERYFKWYLPVYQDDFANNRR